MEEKQPLKIKDPSKCECDLLINGSDATSLDLRSLIPPSCENPRKEALTPSHAPLLHIANSPHIPPFISCPPSLISCTQQVTPSLLFFMQVPMVHIFHASQTLWPHISMS